MVRLPLELGATFFYNLWELSMSWYFLFQVKDKSANQYRFLNENLGSIVDAYE